MSGGYQHEETFGARLARLRRQRRLSQLALSLTADVSTRHLSFLETGRSAPTREMVARLAVALDLGVAEKSDLLRAAGFWDRPPPSDKPVARDGHSDRDLDAILAIETAADADQALSIAAAQLSRIGLGQFFTGTMRHGADGGSVAITHHHLSHAPLGWMMHYHARNYAPIDPLITETGRRHLPFFWSDLFQPRAIRRPMVSRMFNEGRTFRITNGFVMPIHRADGSVHALSAMAERIDTKDPRVRMTARTVAIALLHRLDAVGHPVNKLDQGIGQKEQDCLRHVLDGRPHGELARRLSMDADATSRMLSRLCRTFGTSEPLEAALRARRSGLLPG